MRACYNESFALRILCSGNVRLKTVLTPHIHCLPPAYEPQNTYSKFSIFAGCFFPDYLLITAISELDSPK